MHIYQLCKISTCLCRIKRKRKKNFTIQRRTLALVDCAVLSRTCKTHSKNLFKNNNRELLHLARSLSGERLLLYENLLELICRPCERRLGNFKAFRKFRRVKKKSEQFSKRCVEISPSVVPPATIRLNFTTDDQVSSN